jgi:hypothetical protein
LIATHAIQLAIEVGDKETELRLEPRNWRRSMRAVPATVVSPEVDDYLDAVERKLDRQKRLAFLEFHQ